MGTYNRPIETFQRTKVELSSFAMLLYSKELVAPPSRLRNGLQRFKRHPLRDKYGQMLRESFDHSTIHGMQNVVEEDHLYVRYFWLIIVIGATSGFLSTYSILEEHHNEQRLVSLVESTQLPVYNIEFPAVAICPWNHVNWLRAATAAERFLPPNANAYARDAFHQLLLSMEQLVFGKFQPLGNLTKLNLTSLAQLSLSRLTSYLAYRCDEMFVTDSCVFDETVFDCCHLFVPEHTELGQCLVFNSLISDDSRKKQLVNEYYPYKLSTAGEGSGLKFMLSLNKSFLRKGIEAPFAMNLMIKDSRQWSRPMVYHLHGNTENFVSVDPMLIDTSTNTYKLDPTKRRCYFDDERNPYFHYSSLPYNSWNCIAWCRQLTVLQHCKCTLPQYLPPLDRTRECNVLDIECLYNNTDIFDYVKIIGQEKYINDVRRGHYCSCPDSCNTHRYATLLNVRQLIKNNTNATETQRHILTEVYYEQRVMTKIETQLKFTIYDWLASFGGILGLYVGASALSFAELVYVFGKLLCSMIQDGYNKIHSK